MNELLTPDEMAACDRLAIAGGIAGHRADGEGRPRGRRRGCAPPARHARRRGRRTRQQWRRWVRRGAGAGRARLSGARAAARRRGGAARRRRRGSARYGHGRSSRRRRRRLRGAGVIIDALFGAGLNRAVEGEARALIEAMNASGAPIVAVDLPSGINGASGAVMGAAVKAPRASPSSAANRGMCCCPAGCMPASVRVADIGIPDSVLDRFGRRRSPTAPQLWGATFPVPRLDGHKYSRGHAVVVSGDLSFTGAARLAARGALRAGAGLVTLASPRAALAGQCGRKPCRHGARGRWRGRAAQRCSPTSGSTRSCSGPGSASARRRGPRRGRARRRARGGARCRCADELCGQPECAVCGDRGAAGRPVVLTPHQGEFSQTVQENSASIWNNIKT